MGQLEKYGLYVLCLVIFLILGVTIWGTPASATKKSQRENVAIRANALGIEPNARRASPASVGALPGGSGNPNRLLVQPSVAGGEQGLLDSWLKPGARPPQPVKDPVKPVGSGKPSSGPAAGGPTAGDPPAGGSAGVQTAPVKPEQPATRKYKVRKDDTLGAIAQKQLGSTRHVKLIKQLNPGLDERRLSIGKEIVLPGAAIVASEATPSSYRTYTISKGDSFERIARVELGSAKRVKEVMRLNPNVDPRRLRLGKKIKLPLK